MCFHFVSNKKHLFNCLEFGFTGPAELFPTIFCSGIFHRKFLDLFVISGQSFMFSVWKSGSQVCREPSDICLIIDASGSIKDMNPLNRSFDNWDLVREFASQLVDYFTVGPTATRFGVVLFSERVFLEIPLNRFTNAADLKSALRSLRYLGKETNTPEAIRVTREQCFGVANGDRPDIQNVAILISDGVPYPRERRDQAIQEAQVLRALNARLIAVGVTENIDVHLLRELSSVPKLENQDFFRAASFSALGAISLSVAEVGCEVPTTGRPNSCIFSFVGFQCSKERLYLRRHQSVSRRGRLRGPHHR